VDLVAGVKLRNVDWELVAIVAFCIAIFVVAMIAAGTEMRYG